MPKPLRLLLARTLAAIAKLTQQLERGTLAPEAWHDAMARTLRRAHQAALMAGQGSPTISKPGRSWLDTFIGVQLDFLRRFAVEVQSAGEYQKGWQARAALYGAAVKAPYWYGATKMLPLPAMPGDGSTACLGNCSCSWDVEAVGDGDYDCYWRMGATEHCQGCKQRAEEWNPIRVRGGELE
jgi:hypothetical protein